MVTGGDDVRWSALLVDQDAPRDVGAYRQALGLRRAGRATTGISVAFGGAAYGAGVASDPKLSRDGRFVAYDSSAPDLVEGDGNGTLDVFVFDRLTGTTELVSVASDGTQANRTSRAQAISPDGRFVTFRSEATNLVPGDTGAGRYVHDRLTGTTTLADPPVSVPGLASFSAVSEDGRYGLFATSAAGTVPDDTNGKSDVFVHDLVTAS